MCRRTPSARAVSQRLAITIFLSVACGLNASAQQAGGLQPPPAATPGGAQPFFPRASIPFLAQQDVLTIPPVIERPLPGVASEAEPRIQVSEIEVELVVDRPEQAISVTAIQAIVSAVLGAQPPEGYTVNELQGIADEITDYYRARGLILAQAIVPAQDVQNGVVTMQVIEGTLGAVEVEGNELYASNVLLAPFEELLFLPVDESAIEEALLTVRNYPGITIFGTFTEGGALGDTNLQLRVQDEDRFSITPRIDNYGSAFTGETRGYVQFEVNNPFGSADQLSGYIVQTFNPENGTYGGLTYSNTLGDGKTAVGFGISKNTFDVTDVTTGVKLDLEGDVEQANLFIRQAYHNTRTFSANGIVDFSRRDAVTSQPGAGVNLIDELSTLSYTYDYFALSRGRRAVNVGYFTVLVGDNDTDEPSRTGRDSSGNVITGTGSYQKIAYGFERLQSLGEHQALLFKTNGQYSEDLLSSLEQYSIGGPANVRAFPVAEFLVDSGGSATLEWIIDAPGFADKPIYFSSEGRVWGDVFQLSFYYDYAGGEINDPLRFQEEDRRVSFRGTGVGLQFGVAEKFFLRIDAAKAQGTRTASNERDPQYYLSFSYTF